jgi:hypothetical protein
MGVEDHHPRRRSMDREQWPDARINDFVDATRHQLDALGSGVGQVVVHGMTLEVLNEKLAEMRDMLRETRDLCKATNGRVTELERARIADEAVRRDRALALEESRKSLALRLAATGWVRPTLIGGAMGLVAAFAPRLL